MTPIASLYSSYVDKSNFGKCHQIHVQCISKHDEQFNDTIKKIYFVIIDNCKVNSIKIENPNSMRSSGDFKQLLISYPCSCLSYTRIKDMKLNVPGRWTVLHFWRGIFSRYCTELSSGEIQVLPYTKLK